MDAVSRRFRLPAGWIDGLAGATAASLGHALAFAGLPGPAGFDLKFLLSAPGNLLLGGALALCCRRGPRAFWLGAAPGLGAAAGGYALGPLLCTLLAVPAALAAARLGAPPRRLNDVLAAGGPLLCLILFLGAGARPLRTQPPRRPLAPFPPPAAAAASGPDVVVLSLDTLRADARRNAPVALPALAALRAPPLGIERALTPAPTAVASHLAMFTGVDPLAQGGYDAQGFYVPDAPAPPLAALLRAAGWRTVGLVTSSLQTDVAIDARGFEVFENLAYRDPRLALAALAWRGTWLGRLLPNPYDAAVIHELCRRRLPGLSRDLRGLLLGDSPGAATRDRALAYLEPLAAGERPFFLFLHFVDLHQPYRPDPAYAGTATAGRAWPARYADARPDTPGIAERIAADLQAGVPEAAAAADFLHAVYAEELAFLDSCLGAVLDALAASGRPTVVLLTSNHGEHFGEYGLMGHGNSVHEELLRVPLLLSGPGIAPGARRPGPASLLDVTPTLLRRCGLPVPDGVAGRDLLAPPPAEAAPFLASSSTELAVYHGAWKLRCRHQDLGGPAPALVPLALHDLAADPDLQEDLLPQQAERGALLRARAEALLAELSAARRAH